MAESVEALHFWVAAYLMIKTHIKPDEEMSNRWNDDGQRWLALNTGGSDSKLFSCSINEVLTERFNKWNWCEAARTFFNVVSLCSLGLIKLQKHTIKS